MMPIRTFIALYTPVHRRPIIAREAQLELNTAQAAFKLLLIGELAAIVSVIGKYHMAANMDKGIAVRKKL